MSDLLPSQIEALRKMTDSERFAKGMRFLRQCRKILAAGVRSRNPDWSEEQVEVETRRLIHRDPY